MRFHHALFLCILFLVTGFYTYPNYTPLEPPRNCYLAGGLQGDRGDAGGGKGRLHCLYF
jgi:hypothetical protein